MKKILYTKDNREVSLEIAEPANIRSFFVFALPKSGSVLQDKIFEDICSELNIPLVSVAKSAFNQGIEESNFSEEICDLFLEQGYGYYGFRYFPSYLCNFDLSKFKKILLIRDPRDILVSHYFSMKNSHAIPKGEMGNRLLEHRKNIQDMDINEYVLNKADTFLKIFQSYINIKDDLLRIFRYEDIVFEKNKWIQDILSFLNLEYLSLKKNEIELIAQKHDIFPKNETQNSHIRKVTPGDYKEKLNADTICTLNEIYENILIKYDYELKQKKSDIYY